MSTWTTDRLTALRRRSTVLRTQVITYNTDQQTGPDPAAVAAAAAGQYALDTAYAAGLHHGLDHAHPSDPDYDGPDYGGPGV